MKSNKRFRVFVVRLLLLCAASVVVPLGGCASFHAEAIEGWVADAETGIPVEGVVIVAHWALDNPINGSPVEQVQIFETVTDKDGRYAFPAWGPKWVTTAGVMRTTSPTLWMFKPGYRPRAATNLYYYFKEYGTSRFLHNKEKLKLERFKGTLSEYEQTFSFLNSGLWSAGYAGGAPCGWESFPRMLRAIDTQYAEFRRAGINTSNVLERLRSNDGSLKAANCGSVHDLIKP